MSLFTWKNTLVEAKFSTSGIPKVSAAQKLALEELPNYKIVVTTPADVVAAGQVAGAASGSVVGVAGSTAASVIGRSSAAETGENSDK